MAETCSKNAAPAFTGKDKLVKADGELHRLLHLAMLNRGIFPAKRELYCTSTVMAEAEVDQAVAAFGDALQELRPYIEERLPHLLAL